MRKVKNLEELVNFRIKTVSDNLIEEGTLVNGISKQKGLYDLRRVIDPLLTNTIHPAVTKKTANIHDDSILAASDDSNDAEQSKPNRSTNSLPKVKSMLRNMQKQS